ncbi:hypothetical protein B0O80DRAFT_4403 [Mortierella sp. GBAus27b]|nr:hypothetical protein B0O80DRAFT_4403 [Mortierella sp. GBAus27b]
MTTPLPPRLHWHDRVLLKIAKLSRTWPLSVAAFIVGFLEVVVNINQLMLQYNLGSNTTKLRQQWIDYAKAKASETNSRRVAVVTGGNTGLGYETAKALVEAGFRTVIACRTIARAKEAVTRLEAETGTQGMVSVMALDLSSQESVKSFVRDFKALGFDHLDVLVNNAGMMNIPYGLTKEGYEMQFGVNHLGHYLLTVQLLPLLNKAPQGRIVVLSSGAMYSSDEIPYDHLQDRKKYSPLGNYSYSKLADMLFAKALSRRLQEAKSKVTVNACHPGACSTELFRHDAVINAFMLPARLVMRSAQRGAMSSIYLALAPGLEDVTGEYFFDQIPRTPNPIALDVQAQELLWAKSVEWTGVDFAL